MLIIHTIRVNILQIQVVIKISILEKGEKLGDMFLDTKGK